MGNSSTCTGNHAALSNNEKDEARLQELVGKGARQNAERKASGEELMKCNQSLEANKILHTLTQMQTNALYFCAVSLNQACNTEKGQEN